MYFKGDRRTSHIRERCPTYLFPLLPSVTPLLFSWSFLIVFFFGPLHVLTADFCRYFRIQNYTFCYLRDRLPHMTFSLPITQSRYWLYCIVYFFVFAYPLQALQIPFIAQSLATLLLGILGPALVIIVCDKYKLHFITPAYVTIVIVLASLLFSYFFFGGPYLYYYSFVAYALFPFALWNGFDVLGFRFLNDLFSSQQLIGVAVYWLGVFVIPFLPKLLPKKSLPIILCIFALLVFVSLNGCDRAATFSL